MKLSQLLKPISRTEVVDQTKEYRLLGVRLEGAGVFHRETKLGSQISARTLNQVRSGDFIYSRLFAWRGAFGVITPEMDACYVSSEFPTFVPVSHDIDLDFLRFWFRLPTTLSQVDSNSSGSTKLSRNRFKENFFLDLEIPLPPLEEQRRIVARIDELAARIAEARRIRQGIEKETWALLLSAYNKITKGAARLPMAEVAPLVRRPVQVDIAEKYYELGIRSFGKGTFHKPAIQGAEIGTKKIFYIEPGDLVFNIVFAWEGAVAVARQEDAGRVGSHRFLTCVAREGLATPTYLCFHFLTAEGLEELGKASPGGVDRNRTLGRDALAKIQVPIPAYEKQLWFDKLSAKVDALKKSQAETAAELDALLPAILDRAFKGRL